MSDVLSVSISPIDGFETFYNVISLVFETLFYGVFDLSLRLHTLNWDIRDSSSPFTFWFSRIIVSRWSELIVIRWLTSMIRKRGRGTRPKMHILFAILIPFLLSSIYWVLQFASVVVRVQTFLGLSKQHTLSEWTYYMNLFNAIVLINVCSCPSSFRSGIWRPAVFQYLVSDGVVVWRAWVLCKEEFGKIVFIPVFLFMLMTRKSSFDKPHERHYTDQFYPQSSSHPSYVSGSPATSPLLDPMLVVPRPSLRR